ncbi:hypothetical protein CK507_01300 [Pseudomonas sp. WN033]|nr:hypothetical protein CK507_01300 [Pseudomonas sp. WN033]
MPSYVPRLLLLLGLSAPGVASAQFTPGLCLGYMPILSSYEAETIASQPAPEYAGSVHLLRAREVRERGETYNRMASQLQRLHQRDFASDFEQDRLYAAAIGHNHVEALRAGTPELRQQANQQYRSIEEGCAGLLARARSLGSVGAFEALMESMGADAN